MCCTDIMYVLLTNNNQNQKFSRNKQTSDTLIHQEKSNPILLVGSIIQIYGPKGQLKS